MIGTTLPVEVVVSIYELRSSESRELGSVDIVVRDPLLTQTDHLKANVLSFSVTIQPESEVLCLLGQLLHNSE